MRIYAPEGIPESVQQDLAKKGIPCKIFTQNFNIRRQTDIVSCPVFSLRDISQFFQYPELMDQIEVKAVAESQEIKDSVTKVKFSAYPSPLMNSAQSLTFIEHYDHDEETSVRAELDSKGKITAEQKLFRPLDKKETNMLIADRRLKYEEVLYSAVIAGVIQ